MVGTDRAPHAENMSNIMLLRNDTDRHQEHLARPKENHEEAAVDQGATCRGLCISLYPRQ
jgi:hypothetical protein